MRPMWEGTRHCLIWRNRGSEPRDKSAREQDGVGKDDERQRQRLIPQMAGV